MASLLFDVGEPGAHWPSNATTMPYAGFARNHSMVARAKAGCYWPLWQDLHNGHYEKVAVMKSCPPVGAPAVVWVANRLAVPIHNFVATLGGKLGANGADGAGGVLRRFGGGSACLVRPARPRLFTFAVTTAAAQVSTPRSAGIMRSRSAQTNLPS